MILSPPSKGVFFLALAVAVVAALSALGRIAVVPVESVWIMGAAYGVVAIGCLVRGL